VLLAQIWVDKKIIGGVLIGFPIINYLGFDLVIGVVVKQKP
jgi:hypothetical protein